MRDAGVGQPPRRRHDRVDVEERLAHSHEDEVIDGLEPPEVQRLVEDLPRGQVAPEAHLPRGAERAGQRTARLRGDADGAAAVAVAHQHGLDRMPVVRVEEGLHRAVARMGPLDHRQRRERHLIGQRSAKTGGHVGHLGVVARAARNPGPDLARAVGRLAALRERRLEQREVHAATVACAP